MAKSPYKQRRPGTLKAAVHELIVACGGLERAAEIARVRKAQLFRYTDDSDDNADCHMPADIVAALERYCDLPLVTEWLAAEHGSALLPLALSPSEETIPQDVAEIAEHASKLFHEFARASTDGTIDAAEAARMLAAGDDMIREYMHLRPALTSRITRG
ncbi:phage regulatory CII family protein [Roseomonas genomospecies 6]|uniref:Uncharacterized protein n=1 Tax=Roseomonas genomospecies 6 TaxID=214106 RepID=A0A9W7KS61_9PROT|nr:phage regulatory CII family protein [Roseomonas genomospecies 6]KAA0678112.1 hypothetical protein DS843_21250 [Roseomonas genomospecies 6]